MTKVLQHIAAVGLVVGVLALPFAWLGVPTIDREGYVSAPSLWAVLFPQVEAAYRYSIMKSLAAYSITFSTAALTGTKTITSVTEANACVQYGGYGTHDYWGNTASFNALGYQITAATTVTAHVGAVPTTHADNVTGGFTVIEFYPGILNSVQQAVPTDVGTSATATITAVTVAKTWLCNGGWTTTAATARLIDVMQNNATMTSTTVMTVEHLNTGGATWNGYETAMNFK